MYFSKQWKLIRATTMYVCVSWSHFCCLFFFLLLPEKQFESLQSKSCHSKFMAKLKQISTTEVTRSFHMLYSKHPHKSAYENIVKKWVITYFCLFTYCFFIIILEYYSLLWGSFCSILCKVTFLVCDRLFIPKPCIYATKEAPANLLSAACIRSTQSIV